MDGLLDFAKSPEGQGLLAAAFGGLAGARRGNPINTLGIAGMSGIAGYSAASSNALKNQAFQMKKDQMEQLPSLYSTDNAGNTTFDFKRGAALGLPAKDMMVLSQLPMASMPKVARTVDVPSPDGGKQTMQYDDYGRPVGQAIDSYVAPQLVDTGAAKQFAIPKAGQSFAMSMTPGEQASNSRGWADINIKQQQNSILNDANNINKEAQRIQIITGPDGNSYRVDKGTGQATPVVTQSGAPFQDGTASKLTESEGKNTLYLSQMLDASNTFDKIGGKVSPARVALTNNPYTNAFAGELGQQVAQTQRQWAESYLRAKTGAAATAGEIENNIRTFFPVVGDTEAVIKQKAEARRQTERDMRIPAGRGADKAGSRNVVASQNQTQQAAPQQPAQQPAASRAIVRTGKDASGRKVIQYSDGSIEYGN